MTVAGEGFSTACRSDAACRAIASTEDTLRRSVISRIRLALVSMGSQDHQTLAALHGKMVTDLCPSAKEVAARASLFNIE